MLKSLAMVSVAARALTVLFFVLGAVERASAVSKLGSSSTSTLRGKKRSADTFIRSLEFKHVLRICNAYPYEAGLSIAVGKDKLTAKALEYKSCGEYNRQLNAGDKVDFQIEESNVGTFTISELPAENAVMLMVIYRHDTLSTAVAFESHVFAELPNAQIAVIDAYKGSESSDIRIDDAHVSKKNKEDAVSRAELLRYSSVVAVNKGLYSVQLHDRKSPEKIVAKKELVALPKESYLVARVGVQAQEGKSYPQDIIVFPRSDKADLGAAVHAHGAARFALIMTTAACFFAAWA